MSYTGVTINGTDTLTQWGLILLDDLHIGEAPLKGELVDVPGADGALNLSYGLSGRPVFGMRDISFTLFASGLSRSGTQLLHNRPKNEEEVNLIRTELQGLYHGREVDLYLPDDATHYWHGIISIGPKDKFNSGRIPISITAQPYRLKTAVTEATFSIAGNRVQTITLSNEGMRVSPLVSTNKVCTINKDGHYWSLEPNTVDAKLSGFYLDAGTTSLVINTSGATSTVTLKFKYQEGRL